MEDVSIGWTQLDEGCTDTSLYISLYLPENDFKVQFFITCGKFSCFQYYIVYPFYAQWPSNYVFLR